MKRNTLELNGIIQQLGFWRNAIAKQKREIARAKRRGANCAEICPMEITLETYYKMLSEWLDKYDCWYSGKPLVQWQATSGKPLDYNEGIEL